MLNIIKISHIDTHMTNNSIFIKTFNNQLEEFLGDLCILFPDDSEIETLMKTIKRVRGVNPVISINAFKSYVTSKYREQILNNDLKFFIEKDYESDLVNTNMTERITSKINELRGPIGNLPTHDQSNVMKYLNNLVKLTDLYKK
jgi:hypothetical protein